ncbi:MAG: class D beta-lactamase [Cetobacterium sp.]
MKKRIIYYISMLLMILNVQLHAVNFKNNQQIANIFKNEGIKGTFIVYDVQNNEFIGYNEKRGEQYYPPASTFKIFNSLIGLSTGAVKSVDEIFYHYDGSKVFLESWKNDMSLKKAIKISQVPAYKQLARMIGLKNMQENITKLNYGNEKIGNKIDTFWLEGPLEITAIQQTELLAKLATKKLPYPKDLQNSVCEIIELEKGKDWTLYGKTGWATAKLNPSIGWFVGWVEQNGQIYSFAINMDIKNSSMLPKREEIAKKSLKILGLLKED